MPLQYIYRTRDKIRDFYEVWIKCPFFPHLKQGCALRKILGCPAYDLYIYIKKNKIVQSQEQKLGTRDCQALLDFIPVKRSCVGDHFTSNLPLTFPEFLSTFVEDLQGKILSQLERAPCDNFESDWSERKTKIWLHQITVDFVKFDDFVTLTYQLLL